MSTREEALARVAKAKKELREAKKVLAKELEPDYAYVEVKVTMVVRVDLKDHLGGRRTENEVLHLGKDFFDKENVNRLNKWDPDSNLMAYAFGAAKIVQQDEGDWE